MITVLRKVICNTPTHSSKKYRSFTTQATQTDSQRISLVPCTQRDGRTKSKMIKRPPSNLIEIKPTIEFDNVSNLPARKMTVGRLNCSSARNKSDAIAAYPVSPPIYVPYLVHYGSVGGLIMYRGLI